MRESRRGLARDLLVPPAFAEALRTSGSGAYAAIPRTALRDPWDRFIVATARALEAPLVTRDAAIQQAQLVQTIW